MGKELPRGAVGGEMSMGTVEIERSALWILTVIKSTTTSWDGSPLVSFAGRGAIG